MKSKKEDDKLEKIERSIRIYKIAAFVCIAIGFLSMAAVWYQNKFVAPMQWNEIGDYLSGTMVGMWSLAGLFFIYVAFLGQRLDIQLTKNELHETRKVHNKQTTLINRQQFDNLFFNLIETYIQIVADLNMDIEKSFGFVDTHNYINCKGREVFRVAYTERFEPYFKENSSLTLYESFHDKYGSNFGHYFRFLYRMVDTVDRQNFIQEIEFPSQVLDDEKKFIKQQMNFQIQYEYTNIIRSLLSDYELELLFLNMLSFKDLKFKPLIEKFVLLKNIRNAKEKLDNKDYDFHPGAILKEENPNFN
jgi:hypothetical protein